MRFEGSVKGREKVATVVLVLAGSLFTWLILRGAGVLKSRGPEVVLMGDSITDQTAEVFAQRLGDRWDLTTSGTPGYRADQRVGDVANLALHDPTQVIINLGTNDVLQKKAPAETLDALEKVGSGFAPARCVYLVTVTSSFINPQDTALPARAQELNAGIRDLAARHHWGVVPWDQLVADYDAGPQPEGPLTTDTVHPTDVGKRMLADAYAKALDDCRV
jgi:lysophospholipase L1-like esterase